MNQLPTRPIVRAPSRSQLIEGLRRAPVVSMTAAVAYIERKDQMQNRTNMVQNNAFTSMGMILQLGAIANALEGVPTWKDDLAKSVSYVLFGNRLRYFWHVQFPHVFPNAPRPLRAMSWEKWTNGMAFAFAFGWIEEATYHGYLIHAALNQNFQDETSYDTERRRAHAFMLRLFANWRNDGTGHRFPQWAHTVAAYEELLKHWREPPDVLVPLLLAACDHHLEQGELDTENEFHDFGDDRISRVPVEIFLLLRLRELEGLANPRLDHPLMEAPFDALPAPLSMPPPDDLMLGTLARAHADWPNLESVVAPEAVRTAARQQG